jgi:serine phosphatase RsbU (regulator of sigma subunit)
MTGPSRPLLEASPAFRQALLKSERKRILGVISFVLFFSVLAAVRIFVLGSAMSHWGLVAAAIIVAFELFLLRYVNSTLRSGEAIPKLLWNSTIALESLFPAVGITFLASTRLLPDYRPLATPWVLVFFPFILLSVLRLSPRLCLITGVCSAIGYLIAAFVSGWRFAGSDGFTVTETAIAYFAAVILATGMLAATVATQIRSHVEAALREAETEHQLRQVHHELQIARSIQQSLLPKIRPQIRGFEVAGWSQTAEDTGGDFYDWKKLPDGRWVVILADVTGHGIGPAILASVCRAYSRATFNLRDSLDKMLKSINLSFAEDLTPERFATFVAAVCQEGSDQLELLSAGHAPILIYSAEDKSLKILEAQALPLGMFPDLWDALPVKLSMKPGDIVVLITDGFLEWENNSGEPFGNDRVAAVLRQFSHSEPEIIIAELYDSVLKFANGAPQQDDLTAVLIKKGPLVENSTAIDDRRFHSLNSGSR